MVGISIIADVIVREGLLRSTWSSIMFLLPGALQSYSDAIGQSVFGDTTSRPVRRLKNVPLLLAKRGLLSMLGMC